MAVYADKKAGGVLTGRWRVESQQGKQRYRARHDTHTAALADDARVKALWAAGEAPSGPAKDIKAPSAHTITSVAHEASGALWRGSTGEQLNWAHIQLMGELIGPEFPIDEIETPHLTKAVRELTKLGKKDATVNRYLSHFRTFLRWAEDEGLRTVPVSAIKFRWMEESRGRVRWITQGEEAQLKTHLRPDLWRLVKVAIETGCRRSELLKLEPQDIVGNLMHLWEVKNKYPRTIPMSQETTDMVLWLLKNGIPTEAMLRRHWDKAKAKMGLQGDRQFLFHIARHTCATRMVDVGEDVLVIKEWLGHKRIETTQIYAHVKPSNLMDALKRRGIAEAIMAQEALNKANNNSPPPPPSGGEIGPETGLIAA